MQSAYQQATELLNGGQSATQSAIDDAAEELEKAIANLIPTTQVNATVLYEAIQEVESRGYRQEDYTPETWTAYRTVYEKGKAYLASLYDQDGNPTMENKAEHQDTVEQYAEELLAAAGDLDAVYTGDDQVTSASIYRQSLAGMLAQFAGALEHESDYTKESFTAFQTAYQEAQSYYQQHGPIGTSVSDSVLNGYQRHAAALWSAYYEGLESAKETISVSLRVADSQVAYDLASPDGAKLGLPPSEGIYENPDVSLSGAGRTVAGLVASAGLQLQVKYSSMTYRATNVAVFVNGIQLRDAGLNPTLLHGVAVAREKWGDIKLRDGDKVVILFAPTPMDREYSAMGETAYVNTTDFWGLLSFEDHAKTVAEGEALTLKVTRTGGWVGSYDGRSAPFNGARLLAVKLDESGAPSGEYQLLEGSTDASGTVTTHLNEAGQYVLVAANPESVVFDRTASGAQYQYASLNAPARTTVTVTPLNEEELAAAKEARKSRLAAALAGCNATELGEAVYAQVKAAHDAGVQAIENATSLKAAEDALSNALTQIKSLVENAEKSNKESVSAMRKYLAKLPTVAQIGEGLFLQSDISTMQKASSHYAGMTGYQKSQLTGQEQAQWEALVKAYGKDGSSLPKKTFTLTFEFIGQEGSSDPFKSFLAHKNSGFRYANSLELSPNDEWWVYIRTETGAALNELDYEIYRVESTGATLSELRLDRPPTDPKGGYDRGWEGVAPFYFADSTTALMPRNDVTVTFHIRGKTSVESLRSSALDQLSEAFKGYKRSDYSDTNWKTLTSAYDEGVSKINAAENAEAIKTALSDALNAMKAVETRVSSGNLGSVHVTVENTTYAAGGFYQNGGAFVEADITLDSDTTMMTAILKALSENGYGWNNGKDTNVTYIENVYYDSNSNGQWDSGETKLAAFDGSVSSGWMGVLNDWFTNEGFASYAVSNVKRDYRLVDGDEIRMMFTMSGYGNDLGGTWGNGDTSLKELEVTGGTLSPAFDGETASYALTLDGSAVSVTPTASNKNFLVKVFINSKTTANNVEYYRRGENLPVQPGDIIYIGVGEYAWPSMNNQSGNTLRYTGTWYSIQVYESGADGIQARIDALPSKSQITYSSYQTYQQTVEALQEDYDALADTTGIDATKLTEAIAQIQAFAAVDRVKAQIAVLPDAAAIQANPSAYRQQVDKAKSAYDALGTGQLYLTVAEVNRLNEAVEALGGSIPQDDVAAVQAFNGLVAQIGEKVTTGSKSAIEAARAGYNDLTQAQKDLVASAPDAYNTLLSAEAALPVVEQIAAIGEVTLEKAEAIAAARAAYDAYADKFSAQNMVSNLNVLEAAEAALEALQGGGQDTSGYREALKEALSYLAGSVTSPIVGSEKGEWAVLAQARAGSLDSTTRTSYLANLRTYVQQRGGELDKSADQTLHTEYSRVVLALTSLGEDAEHFQVGDVTYNLVEPLLEPSQDKTSAYAYQVSEQGNNGTIWALIALDSGGYRNDDEGNAARAAWIDLLIDKQQSDGNWPIYNPDQVDTESELGGVDVCAMAVQALAPYYLDQSRFQALGATHSHAELKSAVDKAVNFLSTSQNDTGGYGSAESSAQVIVALAALGRDAATDSDFTKNSISALAGLLGYQQEDGGFSHATGGTNQMASEQAAYALVAYDRFQKKQSPLYDMTDVFTGQPSDTHTIHAEAGTGGSIAPSGTFTVGDGADVTFTITPNDGYQIADIQVDGNSVWAGGSAVQSAMAIISDSNLIEEAETAETCANGTHIGERVVIGRRAATCTEPGYTGDTICGSCGKVLESGMETGLAAHQYASGWQSDATGHWHICLVCGEKSAVESHVFENEESSDLPETGPKEGSDVEETEDETALTETNDETEEGTAETENPEDSLLSLAGIHPMLLMNVGSGLTPVDAAAPTTEDAVCQVCGYSETAGSTATCDHHGGTTTCTALAICQDCGLPYGGYAEHSFTEMVHSSGMHWSVCADCGMEDVSTLASHSWVLDESSSTETADVYVCLDCGAERTETVAEVFPIPLEENAMLTASAATVQTYTLENVTSDHTVSVTFEVLTPVIEQEVTVGGDTQTATITSNAISEAVKAVKETSADTITVIPTEVSSGTRAVSVVLPAGSAHSIANAGAGLAVQTPKGNVTLSEEVLSSIQDPGELIIRVEETSILTVAEQLPTGTDLTNSTAVEVTITVGGQELTTFGGHGLTVMIPVGSNFTLGQQYDVLVISDNGTVETLTGRCVISDGQRYVTVSVDHLSTFVVLADAMEEIYTITATAGAGGRIEPAGETKVTAGGSQTYYITPDEGYVVDDVLVDWRSVGAVDSYTFRNVDADHEIRATFRRGVEIPDFGPVIGSVYISVENNTYSGGDFRGTLVSGWYDLCARDTMMTSVLKALALGGYSWWGTGASDTGGYDITYLSGIYVDENRNGRKDSSEPSLAEFDGARGAGWMGTLNDWFVNEGFQSFRANGSGNYELGDGDYLNIVYTCNLGEDVGSLWGNTDTSLASLRISGGTLRPSFDGDTLEYTLSISGNSARVTVTPTAVNKNYMVKTFLNYYNRDSACYKRTQTITVKPGDVLYIGVGEPSWPSMNNQGSDAVNYTATRYTITVVSNNSAEAVIEMIKALPEITYANYKTQAAKVAAARAAYHALSSDSKAKVSRTLLDKLEEAEAKVKFYEQIDDVKELLRALPKVDRGSTPSTRLIQQVKEAAAAYKNLNEEQKTYITAEDAEWYEALRLWLIETGAVKPDELPVIDGNFVMPELDGIEILLEPKATVDSNGKAVATVTSAEFNTLLEEAVEAGATLIVIAPTGAERATDISVELPRRALSGVIDETDAGLAVRTHLGETNIPNSTLAKILEEANGQDLTVRMEEHPASEARTLLANKVDIPEDRLEDASVTKVTITSGSKSITSFGGRAITLLLPVSESLFQTGKRCVVYQISESGAVDELTGLCRRQNNQLWVEVTTTHLSTFVAVPPIRLPFTDVKESDWFYDAVVYAYINELFNGTSATTFSPNDTMTRAMLVTVLWRMEGEPTMNSTEPFNDVVAGNWYTNAVVWANGSGIVNGTSATTFDPDGSVTREQIAAILYRYAKTKGWDVSSASGLGSFPDSEQVSDWAARAIEWTYAEGLITGKDGGRLDPQGQASRAEVATILMRFLESRS
ncbi:S-layer homology domain-containing protein [Intestinimonas sp. HCP28S3_D6]|uniref:S-layer homology domain-containing protein n=1 Tax=Intestinimonas sp. HCP28S3_D6 TaxID=3438942 RepID=UPI003F8ADB40